VVKDMTDPNDEKGTDFKTKEEAFAFFESLLSKKK
jgi:hypothetical protein